MTRRLSVYLLVLFLCTAVILPAGDVSYYGSNSIGQQLSPLEAPAGSGYALEVTATDTGTQTVLLHDLEVVWSETSSKDGVHRYITRTSPAGSELYRAHYINSRLVSLSQRIDGFTEEETYLYDEDGLLHTIILERGGEVEHTFFFLDDAGRLEGLMVYQGDAPDWELDHTLLFTSSQDAFAIGEAGRFEITYSREDGRDTYSYVGGVLRLETAISRVDGDRQVSERDHQLGTTRLTRYDGETDRVSEEQFTSARAKENYSLSNTYDDFGELSSRTVLDASGTTEYRYTVNDEGRDLVTVVRNGQMHKVITYLDDTREEQVYHNGEFYATIIYSDDNEILEVIND